MGRYNVFKVLPHFHTLSSMKENKPYFKKTYKIEIEFFFWGNSLSMHWVAEIAYHCFSACCFSFRHITYRVYMPFFGWKPQSIFSDDIKNSSSENKKLIQRYSQINFVFFYKTWTGQVRPCVELATGDSFPTVPGGPLGGQV